MGYEYGGLIQAHTFQIGITLLARRTAEDTKTGWESDRGRQTEQAMGTGEVLGMERVTGVGLYPEKGKGMGVTAAEMEMVSVRDGVMPTGMGLETEQEKVEESDREDAGRF